MDGQLTKSNSVDWILYYKSMPIGRITDVLYTDQTWYGVFHLLEGTSPALRRIIEFISFSEGWNRRTEDHPQNPPSPSEFEQFADLVHSSDWTMESLDGQSRPLIEAPLFAPGGCLTWRTE
jgi:hypothetical protein